MKVTVAIIVRNEAGRIGATLADLARLDYPEPYEVLVVDGNSTDGTPDIVHAFVKDHPECPVRLIPEEGRPSHGNARNMAIDHARGEYLAFTDADCEIPRDWLTRLVGVLESERAIDDSVVAAGGIRYPVESDNWKERLLNRMLGSYFGSGGSGGFVLGQNKYTDSIGNYNAIYLHEVARHEKYLPVRFAEDFEFNRRLVKRGHKIVLSDQPRIYHHQDASFKAFARQMFSYGRGQAMIWKQTGEVRRFAPVAALFLLGVVLGWLSLLWSPILFGAYVAILGIYAAVDLVTAVAITIREKAAFGLVATVIFPLQHGAYGLGFINGLLAQTPKPGIEGGGESVASA